MPTATPQRRAAHRPSTLPWIPRWARLRGPRVRLTHHDVIHHPLLGAISPLRHHWAMLVGCALLYWWLGLSVFLAGRWAVDTVRNR